MKVTKLTWAGIRVEAENTAILIDPIYGLPQNAMDYLFGQPKEAYAKWLGQGGVKAVLQTHTHEDHFDSQTIRQLFKDQVPVLIPNESVADAEKSGLHNIIGVKVGDSYQFGPFQVTAFHAVDGFGSPQVSWVVEAEGRKIFHSGDTLWHGFWWHLKKEFGPFDAVFLPINAALIRHPRLEASGEIACMSPEQAVSAARLLEAKNLVPIHFNTYHNPPAYIESNDVLDRLHKAATEKEITVTVLSPGNHIILN